MFWNVCKNIYSWLYFSHTNFSFYSSGTSIFQKKGNNFCKTPANSIKVRTWFNLTTNTGLWWHNLKWPESLGAFPVWEMRVRGWEGRWGSETRQHSDWLQIPRIRDRHVKWSLWEDGLFLFLFIQNFMFITMEQGALSCLLQWNRNRVRFSVDDDSCP